MSARDDQIAGLIIDYIIVNRDPETGEVDARGFINSALVEYGLTESAITKARWRHGDRIYTRKARRDWGDNHDGWIWGLLEDSMPLTPALESSVRVSAMMPEHPADHAAVRWCAA